MIYTESIDQMEKLDQYAKNERWPPKTPMLTGSNRLLMTYIFSAIHYLCTI